MRILILNGPNLNLLGARESSQYGDLTLKDIENLVKMEFNDIEFEFFQSNREGELIDKIQKAPNEFDGVVINPGGYTHSSVAIRDALDLLKIPKLEVHLSNLSSRESFRQNLITTSICDGYVSGFKENGYLAAIYLLKKILDKK